MYIYRISIHTVLSPVLTQTLIIMILYDVKNTILAVLTVTDLVKMNVSFYGFSFNFSLNL